MPTYPNNALNTAGVSFGTSGDDSKGKTPIPQVDISEMATGFKPENTHVSIDKPDDEYSLFDGTLGSIGRGVQTSMLGTSFRVGDAEDDAGAMFRQLMPDLGMKYLPDQEDIREILNAGLATTQMDALYKNLSSKDELRSRIAVISKNQELIAKSDSYGLTSSIFHGVGDAVGDPTSYIGGPLGAAAKAGKLGKIVKPNLAIKLADAGIMAGTSEAFLRNSITGEEANVTGAILGSMVFTGGIHAAGKALDRGKMRIEGIETARNTGQQAPNYRPDHDGTRQDLDEDTEILESGLIVSKGVVPPKASTDGRLGIFKDIATTMHSSNDPAVRELASLLANPTQGYKGEFRNENVTVQDHKNILDMRSNKAISDLRGAIDSYTDRSSVWNGKGYEQHRAEVETIIWDAAEGKVDVDTLPTDLQNIVKHVRDLLDTYDELTSNPSLLSGKQAPALKAGRVKNYMPHQWKDTLVRDLRYKYGQDEAHRLLKESAIRGYEMDDAGRALNDDEIRAAFKQEGDVTPEMVEKYYNDKTFGIIAEDAPMTRHANDTGEATGDLDYFKHRMGVSLMGVVKTPDGQDFKLDDLLDKNLENVLGGYTRAVNGRLAITAGTGLDATELASKIAKMPQSEGKTALTEFLKVVKGTARGDYSSLDLGIDLLRDVTYGLTNGKMGINAIFEGAVNLSRSGYAQGVARTVSNAIGKDPLDFTKQDIVTHIVDGFLGTHLTQRLNLSYVDYKAQQATRMGKNVEELSGLDQALIKARYGTTKAVQWSPQSRFVDGMQKVQIDAGNNTAITEMLASVRSGFKDGIFADDAFFKANHIGENLVSDAKGILADIQKKHEADGYPTDPDWLRKSGFLYDPRASSLSRIAYAYNDETLQKSNLAGQQYLRPLTWYGRMFMQFKRFATGSSQYASKVTKDIVKYKRLDQAGALVMSFGTAYMHYLSLTMMDTMKMDDKQRREYLEENLSPAMSTWGMLKRNQFLAFHGMAYDTLDMVSPVSLPGAGIGRTTGDQTARDLMGAKPESGYGIAQEIGGKVMSNIPASRVAFSGMAALANLGKYGHSKVDPYAYSRAQEDNLLTEFARNFGRATVNNDPISQGFYRMAWKNMFDIDLDSKK